jgi:hypothetical protein
LVSPVIALAVGVVAYQEWKTARDKLRFDLFAEAFEPFLDFRKLQSTTLENGE